MRNLKLLMLLVALAISSVSFGQLSGTKTIPGDYATIAAAIADLNTQGVAAPGVTFDVAAGYTETFATPTAGLITATGTTSNDQIIFQKSGSGANPIITAGVGTSTTVDGIIVIKGGNYITFDGIDLQENALNTTATQQMEWGYALVKSSATDGAQNNNIKNCAITLNKTNTATIGIYSGNHTDANTTSIFVTAVGGANSNNKVNGNTISNVFYGIYLKGYADASPYAFYDQGNEVGVTTGNTISNYGGASSCAGIYVTNNNLTKISNNNISTTASNTLRGIYLSGGTNVSIDVLTNTIVLTSTASNSQLAGIESAISGTTNTINLNNNIIQNCTYTTAASGNFYGIYNNGASSTVNVNGNSVINNTLSGTGSFYGIETGSPTTVNVNNNIITNNIRTTTTTGTTYCIKTTSPATINVSNNTIDGNNFTGAGTTGSIYGFYSNSSAVTVNLTSNIIRNLSVNGAGSIYGIYENGSSTAAPKSFLYNQIYNLSTSAGASTMSGIRLSAGTTNFVTNNVIYSFNSIGGTSGSFYGIWVTSGTTNNINYNNIYNIATSSTNPSLYGVYLAGGTTNNVYNNYISDLRTTAANAGIPLAGIYASSGTTDNIFYNTIYLNAVSTGILFGSAGIYASTTPTVDLRNNIVVNVSTPMGATGYAAAYRRSGTTLTTYSANSNNNCFYAGTPGVNNLIFWDGTNPEQTIAGFQTRMLTRDILSFSELPPFVTIASTPYNLHLQTSIATKCESGGIRITSPAITDDFDGNARWGETTYTGTGSTTDVGADEFNGIPSYTCVAPNPGNTIASSTSICNGQSISLSLQNATAGTGVSYQWQSSPDGIAAYSNILNETAATYSVIPTSATYYQCVVTCLNGPATATSTPIQVAFANSVTSATGGSRCGTGVVSLSATGSAGTTLNWYDAITGGAKIGTGSPINTPSISATTTYYVGAEISAPVNAVIGTGTTLTTASTYPTAFGNYNYQYWSQMVYTAVELQAAGLSAGNITALTFKIAALPDGTNSDYTINMGPSASSTLTGFTTIGLTTVYGPAAPPTIVVGDNTITLTTPYNWDGISNIIVDIRGTGANANANATTYYTTTTSNTVVSAYSFSNTPTFFTSNPSATTSKSRLNIVFAGTNTCSSPRSAVVATIGASPVLTLTANQTVCNNAAATVSVTSTLTDYDSYVWTPNTNLYTDAACTIAYDGIASATTVYLKTATAGDITLTCTSNNSSTMCSNVTTSQVTILPGNPAITASATTLCLNGTSSITTSPTTGYGVSTFQWQNSIDNVTFSDILGANSINYTTPDITSTTYYKLLVKLGANVCSESNVVTVTVNNPQVTSTTPDTRCGTGTVTLGATGSAGTILNWYAAATGGTSLTTGSSFTTPSIVSTTSYYVSADMIGSSVVLPIGLGASTSSTTYTPFNGSYGGIKTQHLYTAAELTTAGIKAGSITSLALDVTAIGSTYNGFYIQMGNTALTTFTATPNIQGGLTTVYNVTSTTPTVGINTYTFTTPFIWDGVSNIIVSISWSNGNTSNTSSTIKVDPTTNYSSQSYRKDSDTPENVLAFTGTTGTLSSSMNRPQIIFGNTQICSSPRSEVIATVSSAPAISLSATPSTICEGSISILTVSSANTGYTYSWSTIETGSSITATPNTNTSYTVTASDISTGCVLTASTDVTVNPLPIVTASASQNTVFCGTLVDLSATPASGNVTLINEDFNETSNNWVTTNTSTGGTPALADWILRADGYSYGSFSPVTFHSNDNSQFYLSNSDAQGSGGIAATILESPSFSTIGMNTLSLSYFHYYRQTSSTGSVEVWNGTTWTSVKSYTATTGTASAFVQETIDISAYVGLSDVKIRFKYDADYGYYWAIDNVVVDAINPTYTYAWSSVPAGLNETTQTVIGQNPIATTDYTVEVTNAAGCSTTANITVTVNPLPAPTVTVENLCGNTNLTASAYTGTLTWSSTAATTATINVTTGGDYTVFQSLNGCTSAYTTATAAPIAIPVPPTVANVTACFGTTISDFTTTATGTINWYSDLALTALVGTGSPFATGETAADVYTYYVNATENTCTGDATTVTLTINALPTVTITASNNPTSCGTSTGDATASTGTSYLWSTTPVAQTTQQATALAAGSYTVTVSDGTCSNTATVVLTDPNAPTVTLSANDTTICAGTSVTFTAGGADTYEFFVGNVSQGAASATNTFTSTTIADGVVITVNGTSTAGCTGTSTAVTMIVNTPAAVTITENNGVLTSSATTGNQWYNAAGIIADSTNQTIAPTTTDDYYVIVTDANGCTVTSNTIHFIYTSVNDLSQVSNVKVFPNPNNGIFNLVVTAANDQNITMELRNIQGQVIFNKQVKANSIYKESFDFSTLAKGVYYLNVNNGTSVKISKVVIK